MPIEGPEGQKWRYFSDCVTSLMGPDTTREEARKACGKWQAESKSD